MIRFFVRRNIPATTFCLKKNLCLSAIPRTSKAAKETDLIFDLYCDNTTELISVGRLLSILHSNGLQKDDPRFLSIFSRIREATDEQSESADAQRAKHIEDVALDRATFHRCVSNRVGVIRRVLQNQLIVPDWKAFVQQIDGIFHDCKQHTNGQVATYIPQLARAEPERWAISICTVDGQRHNWGDYKDTKFCLQSVAKPFSYAMAIEELGADYVHRFVGQEPSGRFFNAICLDHSNRPHNPMINAGAILIASLLNPHIALSDRFDFTIKSIKKFAGGGYVSFDNATFLSERETADRNYALAYFMREHKCFPDAHINIQETLDLYFQLCSIKTNTEALAVMAATLANGGVNPLTDVRVVCNRAVRDTLSLMLSCGMYDYSGQFAFNVGLPAKSGVAGDMIIVVPNVMGIALFSPRLDQLGNTVRGVKFAEGLIKTFNFHQYDNMLFAESEKSDPRNAKRELSRLFVLMNAARDNDVSAIKREILKGTNIEERDYDGRSALHIAASSGSEEALEFLLTRWTASAIDHKDNFGSTPLDSALAMENGQCAALLRARSEKELQ